MARIATYAQQQLSMHYMQHTLSRTAETQIQIASGKKAQQYSGIAGQANQLVSLELSVTRTEQFNRNIDQTIARLNIMESSVATITDRAVSVLSILSSALSGTNLQDIPLSEFAATYRDEIESLLNIKHEDRFLFAGSRTDTAPVDVTDPAYTPQAGLPGVFTADFDYYQGDQQVMAVRIDDNSQTDYGVTADEPAFEMLLRAMAYMDYADVNQDVTVLGEAFDLVNQAVNALTEVRGKIGAVGEVLDQTKSGHDNFLTYAKNLVSSLEDIDIAEATTRLAVDENQLMGSYMAMNRIANLSLLEFLR